MAERKLYGIDHVIERLGDDEQPEEMNPRAGAAGSILNGAGFSASPSRDLALVAGLVFRAFALRTGLNASSTSRIAG